MNIDKQDLYTPAYRAGHPVQFEDAAGNTGPRGGGQYDAQDEAAIHQRLRDLGYVE